MIAVPKKTNQIQTQTHTHTHTHIYIYIYIYMRLGGFTYFVLWEYISIFNLKSSATISPAKIWISQRTVESNLISRRRSKKEGIFHSNCLLALRDLLETTLFFSRELKWCVTKQSDLSYVSLKSFSLNIFECRIQFFISFEFCTHTLTNTHTHTHSHTHTHTHTHIYIYIYIYTSSNSPSSYG